MKHSKARIHNDIFAKCLEFTDPQFVRDQGFYPYFRRIEGTVNNGTKVLVDGKPTIMIGSNNYLGLAQDPRVLEASQEAVRKFGSGCTGSRFLNGNIALHEELEAELASFLGKESVLLFSTGFFANQGALTTLCDAGDYIICDREDHASIVDGGLASRAKMVPYAHNSEKSLRRRLSHLPPEGGKLVVVDGVFSMSGDIINLPEVVKAAEDFGARVYCDEAHSLGVLGPNGEGAVGHFGLQDKVDLIMGTFSKSLGSMGGFIAGPELVIDYLKHKARCLIFTASLAPAVVGGVLKALQIMREEHEHRENLWKNTRKMHEGYKQLGFNIGSTGTPVVPILIGSETKAFIFAKKLLEAGIFATPAVYPAVKYGQAIVRTSYMATHTDDELDYVLSTFEKLGKELDIFQDAAYVGDTNAQKRPTNGFDFNVYEQARAEDVRAASGNNPS